MKETVRLKPVCSHCVHSLRKKRLIAKIGVVTSAARGDFCLLLGNNLGTNSYDILSYCKPLFLALKRYE